MNKTVRATVQAYRKAAAKLWGHIVSDVELETYIVAPDDDPGRNAPDSLCVIYLEADCRKAGDEGMLPALLGYYSPTGWEYRDKLNEEAGMGTFIELQNPAVGAVYE